MRVGGGWNTDVTERHSFNATLDYRFRWYDDSNRRNDDLWNFGGGVAWRFAPGWSLRPTFEYNCEKSNIPALAYSSTELWVTVRKSF